MWEFAAALDGWNEANAVDEPGRLSSDEADELWEWISGN